MEGLPVADGPVTLPRLSPLVRLYQGPSKQNGEPSWTLHHPLSNRYYQIGWAEFECLARFHRYQTAEELLDAIKSETTLDIDLEDIKSLIMFLFSNGLIAGMDRTGFSLGNAKDHPLWKKIIHQYLFFSVPLARPQNFLDRTLRYVEPLFSKLFLYTSYALLAFLILLTVQRSDEFFHTFFNFFSVQGAVMIAVVFTGIKIIHELSHAYTARRYGVPVPHMGVAMIVLYPVLYTEATGTWQLTSRRARMHIGLAGVAAELVIAAYALLLWHILPPGLGQSLAFGAVAISLVGSLLINLNPLMRFDGYYVLSDALGIENLHMQAIGFVRWKMRKVLFGLRGEPPFEQPPEREKFLIGFGAALLVYRFFLYLGIAFMVGHLFFQPLGWILLTVELVWFLGIPIMRELKIWFERRTEIWAQRRGKIAASVLFALALWAVLPTQTTISAPAVYHASLYRALYAPAAGQIKDITVKEGQAVKAGQILMVLASPDLMKDIKTAELELRTLETLKLREQTDAALYRERRGGIEHNIEFAKEKLALLNDRRAQLVLKAEFDGVVRDLNPEVHNGRTVNPETLLLRLVHEDRPHITGYVNEDQAGRMGKTVRAIFMPDYAPFGGLKAELKTAEKVNSKTLPWPELASIYGGPLPAEFFRDAAGGTFIAPRQSLYPVELEVSEKINENQNVTIRGTVRLTAAPTSPLWSFFKAMSALLIREGGLNGA